LAQFGAESIKLKILVNLATRSMTFVRASLAAMAAVAASAAAATQALSNSMCAALIKNFFLSARLADSYIVRNAGICSTRNEILNISFTMPSLTITIESGLKFSSKKTVELCGFVVVV
jgi:hypothetical protein